MIAPGQPWSLWDMLNLKAGRFLHLMGQLHELRGLLIPEAEESPDSRMKTDPVMRRDASEIKRMLTEMQFDYCVDEADRLIGFLQNPVVTAIDAKHRIDTLVDRIQDQCKKQCLLVLTRDESDLYVNTALFGADVATKFPSAIYDIAEAHKCLALGRSTASAFHAIRALEAAILAIARCLGIPDPMKGPDKNWAAMLKTISDEIYVTRWTNATSRFSGEGKTFDEIYGSLAAIQNPYRNTTMHLAKTYTPEQAKYILTVVEGLMQVVSARMDEDGGPLA